MTRAFLLFVSLIVVGAAGCQAKIEADVLIENGLIFVGDNTEGQDLSVAITGGKIIYVGHSTGHIKASETIDADGLYVVPGFIDPHTHSLGELTSDDPEIRENRNYQFQGVTTVINGNDGFGEPNISDQMTSLKEAGIGTNTALFIGHGALRKSIMGGDQRVPTGSELSNMKEEVSRGMEAGALGLSTGLFYAPGSFSETDEIIELAKTVSEYGGIYDSHIRDEATYNIGLEAAVEEIARQANVPTNIAHIKALGVDVWGMSDTLIEKVDAARLEGLGVTADQYPWQASGTRISNALLPRWVKAGTPADYMRRLSDPELSKQIRAETAENLRKRGGPEAVLITQNNANWKDQTLGQLARKYGLTPVEMALKIAREGDARIASFNMNMTDIENFMRQDWVMTSSDGSTGHPRKYASFPKKYQDFVVQKNIIPVETFFYRSSGLVAETFGLCDRGFIKAGYQGDIAIIDPTEYAPKADFQSPAELSVGVEFLLINGEKAIANGQGQSILPGQVLKRCKKAN